MAEDTPKGNESKIMMNVTATVPNIAGKIPPSVILFFGELKINSGLITPIPSIMIFTIRSARTISKNKNSNRVKFMKIKPGISFFLV